MSLKILSKICLLFVLYIIVRYFYIGITTVPTEGDSLNYHIPIAKAYLSGDVFFPEQIKGVPFLKYSPGASQGILAVFYLLSIPPNLFNVLGVILLFVSLIYLGRRFQLGKELSIIFATSIATLNGIVRWLDTQIIDIYLVSFFALSLGLLIKPEKKVSYYIFLGLSLGALAGSKYSGLIFAGILLVVFSKRLLKTISFKRVIIFLIPFLLIGMSWYLRNYLVTGNPLYPQGFLFFKDHGFAILDRQVWSVAISSAHGFFGTMNAFISEYMIWALSIPIAIGGIIWMRVKKIKIESTLLILIFLGIMNYFVYLFLPSDFTHHIMISVIRYSWPAFIPFILALFMIIKKIKKVESAAIITIANFFFLSFPMTYAPKLLFVFIPLAVLLYFRKS